MCCRQGKNGTGIPVIPARAEQRSKHGEAGMKIMSKSPVQVKQVCFSRRRRQEMKEFGNDKILWGSSQRALSLNKNRRF
jgi:hypothetical protein